MILMEEWKDIDGYNGLYKISNYGNIKSFRKSSRSSNKEFYILSCKPDNNGYCTCVLNKDGIRKSYKVHRLVAKAFIPNPNNYTDVNHKDENKSNNRIDNLEWLSHKENMNYGHALDGLKQIRKKISVKQFTLDHILVKEWNCISDAAIYLKISVGNIVNCCKGRCKTVSGYIWKYS